MKILDEIGVATLWEKIKGYVSTKVFNPDDEDLVSEETSEGTSVMKLADRSYAPEKFSGKGYKILRKNIKPVSLAVTKIVITAAPTADGYLSFIINGTETHVDVVSSTDTTPAAVAQKIATKLTDTMEEYEVSVDASTITLTRKFGGEVTASSFSAVDTGASCTITDSTKKEFRNIITSVMVSQPNTIYEIRYDFDLNGTTLEVPEGCTLKFEGGMLKNGGLKGNNTKISLSNNSNIFADSLNVIGYFSNIDFSHLIYKDISNILQNILDKVRYVFLPIGTFYISKQIIINNSNTSIQGVDSNNTTLEYIGETELDCLFKTRYNESDKYYSVWAFRVKGINFLGKQKVDSCLYCRAPSSVFDGVRIQEFRGESIKLINSWCSSVLNCYISYCGIAINLYASHSSLIFNCRIENQEYYDIICSSTANANICYNTLENTKKLSIYVIDSRNLSISNNYFEMNNSISGSEFNVKYGPNSFDDTTKVSPIIYIGGDSPIYKENKILVITNAFQSSNVCITNNHVESKNSTLVMAAAVKGLVIRNNTSLSLNPILIIPYIFDVKVGYMNVSDNMIYEYGEKKKYIGEQVKFIYPVQDSQLYRSYYDCPLFGDIILDDTPKDLSRNINGWNVFRSNDNKNISIVEFKPESFIVKIHNFGTESTFGIFHTALEQGIYCFDINVKVEDEDAEQEIEIVEEYMLKNINVVKTVQTYKVHSEYTNIKLYGIIDKEKKYFDLCDYYLKASNEYTLLVKNPKFYRVGRFIPDNNYYISKSAIYKDICSLSLRTVGCPINTITKPFPDTHEIQICTETSDNPSVPDVWKTIDVKQILNRESQRPIGEYLEKGLQYFDTTLNKPIWWTGSKWVDATGADV